MSILRTLTERSVPSWQWEWNKSSQRVSEVRESRARRRWKTKNLLGDCWSICTGSEVIVDIRVLSIFECSARYETTKGQMCFHARAIVSFYRLRTSNAASLSIACTHDRRNSLRQCLLHERIRRKRHWHRLNCLLSEWCIYSSLPINCSWWRSFLTFPSLNWSHSCVWHAQQHAASVIDLCIHSPSRSLGIHEAIISTRRSARSFPLWMICTWEWLRHRHHRSRHLFSPHSPREWNICACSSINPNDCQSVIYQNQSSRTFVCSADSEAKNRKIHDRLTVANTSDRWSPSATLGLVLTLDSPCPSSLTDWNVWTTISLIFTSTKLVLTLPSLTLICYYVGVSLNLKRMTRTVKHVCLRLRRVPFKITFQFHDDFNEETPLTLSTSL